MSRSALSSRWLMGALALAALGLGLTLTALGVRWMEQRIQAEARTRFENHAVHLEEAILRRFSRAQSAFHGVRSFLEASKTPLDRASFRAWVESRNLAEEFPGVRGFGYIERVPRANLEQFIASERADQAPDFKVRTGGQAPDLYVIKYIEPLANNGPARGYDVGSEAVRRAAVERAVSTGQITLTGHVTLVQDGKKRPGFLYMLPIYRKLPAPDAATPSTPEQRLAALRGLVYSPIVLAELMAGVDAAADKLLDFEIFDGEPTAGLPAIYDNDSHRACPKASSTSTTAFSNCVSRAFTTTRRLDIGGRRLTVALSGLPAFDATVDQSAPRWAALGGAIVSALLAVIICLLGLGRARSVELAERMTEDLLAAKLSSEAAQRELQLRATRFELAIEGGNDGLWEWIDVYGHDEWWSPQFYRLLGYEPDEMPASLVTFDEMLHPDHRERTMEALRHALQGTGVFDLDYPLRCKSGEYRWFHSRAKVYHDEQGQPLRMSGSLQDIHEQRLAKEQIRERNEQLAAIFELSPDGFVLFGEQTVKFVGPAFSHLTGLAAADVLGLSESAFLERLASRCDPATRITTLDDLHSSPPQSPDAAKRVVLELVAPAPRTLQLALHEGDGGQAGGNLRVLHLRDVTHETEVDRMKSEFLSMAAHELRTPMVSIYGFTELLLHREMAAPKQQDLLGRIYRHSQTMINLINELLDLARIEARRDADFKPVLTNLAELVHEVIHDFQPPDGRSAPQRVIHHPDLWAKVDHSKLRQALLNLLSNAYKYSPAGGPVRIELLGGEPPAAAARCGIRISDSGIGMTPDELACMGQRFFRADKSGNIPGTGLGVSIVKEIIGLLGGEMDIRSQPGQGTVVTLWLPAAQAAEVAST